MTALRRAAKSLVDSLRTALTSDALPGETASFGPAEQQKAAEFIADVALIRAPGEIAIRVEWTGGEAGKRRMRLAVVNDDMPFLVDSVAAAIAARGLAVHRLLHPIVCVTATPGHARRAGRRQERIDHLYRARPRRRARQARIGCRLDARPGRRPRRGQRLARDAAEMDSDAASLDERDPENAALLRWLRDDHFTLLGHADLDPGGKMRKGLGILQGRFNPWDEAATKAAIEHLSDDKRNVLILKADRDSPVHRRVPLDVVIVQRPDCSLSVHIGLWTSAALRSPASEVPVLRGRLVTLDRELGIRPLQPRRQGADARHFDPAARFADLLRRSMRCARRR